MSSNTSLLQYRMVANLVTSPFSRVSWYSPNVPDFVGTLSGYSPDQLTNIAIDGQPINLVGPEQFNEPTGPASGDLGGDYPSPEVVGIDGVPINQNITPTNGQVLTYNSSDGYVEWKNLPNLAGDVTGPIGSNTVVKLRGKSLDTSLASLGSAQDGYVLTWQNTAGDWQALPTDTGVVLAGDVTGPANSNIISNISGVSPVNINTQSLQWAATVSAPIITQARSTSGAGTSMFIVGQAAQGSTNTNGGGVLLESGNGAGSGVAGNVVLITGDGSTILQMVPSSGVSLDGNITFVAAPTNGSPVVSQAQASSGAGNNLTVSAQSAATSSNAGGGSVLIGGGAADGSGTAGGVGLSSGDGTSNVQVIPGNIILNTLGNPAGISFQVGGTEYLSLVKEGASTEITMAAASGGLSIEAAKAASGAGQNINIIAQAAATGSNANGGAVSITGGSLDGSGNTGTVSIGANDGTSSVLVKHNIVEVDGTLVLDDYISSAYLLTDSSGNVTAGSAAPILSGGSLTLQTKTVTASSYTIDTSEPDYFILCNRSGAIILTLPTPTAGRSLVIKDISGAAHINNITINPHVAETIDGSSSFVLNLDYGSIGIQSDGTNWWVI